MGPGGLLTRMRVAGGPGRAGGGRAVRSPAAWRAGRTRSGALTRRRARAHTRQPAHESHPSAGGPGSESLTAWWMGAALWLAATWTTMTVKVSSPDWSKLP